MKSDRLVLQMNNAVNFHPDPISNDVALGFSEEITRRRKTQTVPDL